MSGVPAFAAQGYLQRSDRSDTRESRRAVMGLPRRFEYLSGQTYEALSIGSPRNRVTADLWAVRDPRDRASFERLARRCEYLGRQTFATRGRLRISERL